NNYFYNLKLKPTKTMNWKSSKGIFKSILLVVTIFVMVHCKKSSVPDWQEINEKLITEHNLTVRELSDLPNNNIESNLEAGNVQNLDKLAKLELSEGVNAKIFWGTGNMVSVVEMNPNSQIPETVLPADS